MPSHGGLGLSRWGGQGLAPGMVHLTNSQGESCGDPGPSVLELYTEEDTVAPMSCGR